jgi:hypothetical protein
VIVTFLLVSYEAQRHGWILLCLDSSSGVENRVPHLRRGLIATKVGSSCGARSVVQGGESVGIFAAAKIAHLSRLRRRRWGTRVLDVRSDVGGPTVPPVRSVEVIPPTLPLSSI